MDQVFVIDTNVFINYFNVMFNENDRLSSDARRIISRCLDETFPFYKLIIPSMVFVEVFDNMLRTEELLMQFRYEVFNFLNVNPYVEIKPIEKEVLERFIEIDNYENNLENHDKIILSCAMQMNCPLFTFDEKVQTYVGSTGVIPAIYN